MHFPMKHHFSNNCKILNPTLRPLLPEHPVCPCVPFKPGAPRPPCTITQKTQFFMLNMWKKIKSDSEDRNAVNIQFWTVGKFSNRINTLTGLPASPGYPGWPFNPGRPYKAKTKSVKCIRHL